MPGYVFKLGRVTSHERENPHSTEPDNPDTEVITIAAPAPVFVDSTGRRSRRLRRLAYAFGALVMTYGGLIGVSLAGGPVRSSAMLPLPGLEPETEGERVPARPGLTMPPVPARSLTPSQAAATARYITEAMPRRTAVSRPPSPRAEADKVAPKPTAAKPSPSPKPSASTKPTESTTTKPSTRPTTKPVVVPPTTSTPVTTPTVTVPPIVGPQPPAPQPPAPQPPAPKSTASKSTAPKSTAGSGGQGGGSVLGPVEDEPSTDATPSAAATAKPSSAVLINASPSVELADLSEQVEADPEPTGADSPAGGDDA